MPVPKTSRWLDLVAYLLGHRFPVTREAIFEHVGGYDGDAESARRKFERDKDELRALGIAIETVDLADTPGDEPAKAYRLAPRDTYLPYLELLSEPTAAKPYPGLRRMVVSRQELEVLDRATRALAGLSGSPLAAAAASARRKLAFDLPLDPGDAERLLALPVPEHARQALAALQDAVIDQVRVTCRYFTMARRAESARELEPWGLLFQWGRWYCVARASDREEPRLFRVDRMRDVRPVPGRRFRVPDEFDVRSLAGRSPWEFGSGPATTAVVRFQVPESHSVVNRGLGRLVREEAGRSHTVAFDVRDEEAFLRWLLSFGGGARIEEPAAMAASLEALRAEVAALYAEAAP